MIARLVVLVGMLACSCGGSGGTGTDMSGNPTPETWNGNLTGTAPNPDPLGGGSGGTFNESYTFSLTFPSSVVAALQIPYNQDAQIRSGSGTFSGSETVASQPPGGIYTLVPSSVSNVPVSVYRATIVVEGTTPTPEIMFDSQAMQTLILSHVVATSGSDYTDPATRVYLYANSVAATEITGTWDVAGQSNPAQGTFTLAKQ